MDITIGKSDKTGSRDRFAFADQCFDGTDNFRIDLIWLFGFEKLFRFVIDVGGNALVVVDSIRKILNKLQIPQNIIIPYRCIA